MYYYGPMMDGDGWGWEILMMGLWVSFFLVAAVTAIKYLKGHQASDKEEPLDIVKARYARGEITKEVFEQFKKDLQ